MTTAIEDQDSSDSFISRTQLKKEDHALQDLGERLAGLSEDQLGRVGLSDELLEAVVLARKTTAHGARRREVKHIGSLLRQIETEPIEKALEVIARGDYEKTLAFKKLETWRDQLRDGNMTVVEEILSACPLAERRQLTQLARNAKKELEENKGAKASKALFRYLKGVL
jgi:ribosome-associated protein